MTYVHHSMEDSRKDVTWLASLRFKCACTIRGFPVRTATELKLYGKMSRADGEAKSTASHGGRRTGAGRSHVVVLVRERRHVHVWLERSLYQAWVKLRESG